MPVVVEMHNVGDLNLQRDVVAVIEHVLSGRMGDWRVLIVCSQESDRWEMKIFGPNAFERSYTLERTSGEHDPQRIAARLAELFRSGHSAQSREFRQCQAGRTVRDGEVLAAAARRRGVGLCETACRREIPFTMSSRSDSARSRLTIRAFSRFSAFLGLPARALIMIANTARALATPTNTIVVIYAALLAWVLKPVGSRLELCACRSCRR